MLCAIFNQVSFSDYQHFLALNSQRGYTLLVAFLPIITIDKFLIELRLKPLHFVQDVTCFFFVRLQSVFQVRNFLANPFLEPTFNIAYMCNKLLLKALFFCFDSFKMLI